MAETTHISWCDSTFNPWIGCQKVGPPCDGCYAENLMAIRYGRVVWGQPGQGSGTRVRTSEANWRQPLRWNRQASGQNRPWFVFCASLADVFDNHVETGWRRDLFDLIRATPNLTWLLLTKRPQLITKLFVKAMGGERAVLGGELSDHWPRNAAIGCTVATQAEADRDVSHLLLAKRLLNPAFAFLSIEPILGPIDLTRLQLQGCTRNALSGKFHGVKAQGVGPYAGLELELEVDVGPGVDWVIAGGETDQGAHNARPPHPSWFRDLRDQCACSDVPFHFKQWGDWAPVCAIEDTDRFYHPAPERNPEASRRCKVETDVVQLDGSHGDKSDFRTGAMMTMKIGKKAAGRLLDGVEHNAMPEVR